MVKYARTIILLCLLIGTLICVWRIYVIECHRRVLKEDLIELSNIKYGLFNVNEWKVLLSTILSKKIEELNFTPGQRNEMREKISVFLTRVIADLEDRFHEEKSKSIVGIFQSGVASLTGMFDKMKRDVPVFTDQILDFLSHADNRGKVKEYINEKLSEYADKTFAQMDYTLRDQILATHGYQDRVEALSGLTYEVNRLQETTRIYVTGIFAMMSISGMLLLLMKRMRRHEYLMMTALCLVLLIAGLLLPMIEIDARIEEMRLTLLGEEVHFTDQVLYYKSKSILEVVQLMLAQGKADVRMVGVLVLLFSVLFPITKLLASVAYLYRPSLQDQPFVRFMVFRTGKWSMADVMVIAIFMSYIGFSGILTEQLRQLEELTRTIDIVTTNKSALQNGFFLFTGFAVLSLLISHRLQYSEKLKEHS